MKRTIETLSSFKCNKTYESELLNEIDYGNMKVDSLSIDSFWLIGESRINQFQQIDFLKRFNIYVLR